MCVPWRSIATPPRRFMITWSMLRTRRLQGTVRSTRNTGTVGRGRSRLETSRDGPRPLEAAVASDHALVTTVAHSATAPRRATEGRRKKHSKASACDSSPRAIAAAPLDVDALGTISCASNLLVSRSERRDPPAPTGTRPGRCPSRSNRTSPRDIVALTSGPPSPPRGCLTSGPASGAALTGSRIDPIVSAPRAQRDAPQIRGGRHEEERVLGFGAYSEQHSAWR